MIFLIKYWKPIALALAIGALLIGGNIWWSNTKSGLIKQGYDQAMEEVRIKQEEANTKIRERKKVAQHETQTLDRPAIIAELCARNELRDAGNCPH